MRISQSQYNILFWNILFMAIKPKSKKPLSLLANDVCTWYTIIPAMLRNTAINVFVEVHIKEWVYYVWLIYGQNDSVIIIKKYFSVKNNSY